MPSADIPSCPLRGLVVRLAVAGASVSSGITHTVLAGGHVASILRAMDVASLYGCWAKLQRAYESLTYLQALIATSAANKEHGIFAQQEKGTGHVVFNIVFPYAKRLRWAVLVGEIAHDLRSTLDNLVSQLVILNGGTPSRRNEFPIFGDRVEYGQKGGPCLLGTSARARAVIEALQPYHAGDDPTSHPLWLLNEISNQDKHRLLALAFLRVTAGSVRVTPLTPDKFQPFPNVDLSGTDTQLGPFEDKAEWVRMAFVTQRDVKMDYHVAVSVSFAEAGPATGKSVTKTLNAVADFVMTTLDRDFLPLFPEPPRGWPASPLISE